MARAKTVEPFPTTIEGCEAALQEATERKAKIESDLYAGRGDTNSVQALTTADAAIRSAELALEGARKRAAEKAEADRQKAVAELRTRAKEVFGASATAVDTAIDQVGQAITQLVEAVEKMNGESESISASVRQLRPLDLPLDAKLPADLQTIRRLGVHEVTTTRPSNIVAAVMAEVFSNIKTSVDESGAVRALNFPGASADLARIRAMAQAVRSESDR